MGLIVYGHADLDDAVQRHGLGRAGSIMPLATVGTALSAVTRAYHAYAGGEHGAVQFSVASGSPRICTVDLHTDVNQLQRAGELVVEALADVLGRDPARSAVWPGHLDRLPLQWELHDIALGPTGRLALLRVQGPGWVRPDIWPHIRPESQVRTTTASYYTQVTAVIQAWTAAGIPLYQ